MLAECPRKGFGLTQSWARLGPKLVQSQPRVSPRKSQRYTLTSLSEGWEDDTVTTISLDEMHLRFTALVGVLRGIRISPGSICHICVGPEQCSCSELSKHVWPESVRNIWPKSIKICENQLKSPKVNMLKFGDVSFDLDFEW